MNQKRYLTDRTTIIPVISIVLTMSFALGFYYLFEKNNEIRHVETSVSQITDRLSNSLTCLINNSGIEEIDRTIFLEMMDKNIIAIVLNDKNNKFFLGKIKDNQEHIINYHPYGNQDDILNKCILTLKKKIMKDSDYLGEIKIFATDRHIKQYLRILILKFVLLTLVVSFFAVTIISLNLKKQRIAYKNAQAIFNATTDAIYLFDTNGVILAINKAGADRLGIDFNTAIGTNVYLNVSADVEQRRRSRVEESIKTKKPLYYEADLRDKWFDTCLYPVINDGTVTGIVLYGRDITGRKNAEEELRKHHEHLEELVEERTLELKAANKELESFSYSVSHDLRAPLRAIDGFSRILLEDCAANLSAEGQRYLRLVREGARQMGKLIDDLLSFSRLSRQPLSKQSIAPADIVHQVLEQLHYMQENRKVEISISDLPLCQSDPSLLKILYTNLLSNALKFTSKCDNTYIEIGCMNEDGEEIYYVKDNGAGFNMKYADKLFGVFQRLHKVQEYEGTGVGLAIVQRIVNRHGGYIRANSEVDKGTTFYFTLKKGRKLL